MVLTFRGRWVFPAGDVWRGWGRYNGLMRVPTKIPGLRLVTVLLGVYAVVWIALEGQLLRVLFLGMGVTVVGLGWGVQRWLGGRALPLAGWLLLWVGLGLLLGLGSGGLTLFFMALKTGLHAHGPEFTPLQIAWVVQRTPFWGFLGLLLGLGLGLVLGGLAAPGEPEGAETPREPGSPNGQG